MIIEPLKFSNGVALHPTGLRLEVSKVGGKSRNLVLIIDDINPQAHVVHVMSRWDCLRLGVLIAWRSVWAQTPHEKVARELSGR